MPYRLWFIIVGDKKRTSTNFGSVNAGGRTEIWPTHDGKWFTVERRVVSRFEDWKGTMNRTQGRILTEVTAQQSGDFFPQTSREWWMVSTGWMSNQHQNLFLSRTVESKWNELKIEIENWANWEIQSWQRYFAIMVIISSQLSWNGTRIVKLQQTNEREELAFQLHGNIKPKRQADTAKQWKKGKRGNFDLKYVSIQSGLQSFPCLQKTRSHLSWIELIHSYESDVFFSAAEQKQSVACSKTASVRLVGARRAYIFGGKGRRFSVLTAAYILGAQKAAISRSRWRPTVSINGFRLTFAKYKIKQSARIQRNRILSQHGSVVKILSYLYRLLIFYNSIKNSSYQSTWNWFGCFVNMTVRNKKGK